MEFRILGPLEVLEDGRQVGLGGAKQRALLAVLLLHANEVVSTDTPASMRSGRTRFQRPAGRHSRSTSRSSARRSAENDSMTRAPGYLLRGRRRTSSTWSAFRRLVGAGKFAEALALWRGQPLSDFTYQRFAQSEIGRIEELRLACIEDRIDVDLAPAGSAALVASSRRSSQSIRCASDCGPSSCSRSTAQADKRRRSRPIRTPDTPSSRSSGSSHRPSLRELQRACSSRSRRLDLVLTLVDASESSEGPRAACSWGASARSPSYAAGLGRCLSPGRGASSSWSANRASERAGSRGARSASALPWRARPRRSVLGSRRRASVLAVGAVSPRVYRAKRSGTRSARELGGGAVEVAQIIPECALSSPISPSRPLEEEGARFRLFDAVARFLRNIASKRPTRPRSRRSPRCGRAIAA